ncbi:hypothetical protein [Streptomyces sp. CA-106110]|uniref:hypothetical protein n=1 Tax=Streptomyces sp. CA-106110 TaxID=3240044 RepID=UPI003D8C9728
MFQEYPWNEALAFKLFRFLADSDSSISEDERKILYNQTCHSLAAAKAALASPDTLSMAPGTEGRSVPESVTKRALWAYGDVSGSDIPMPSLVVQGGKDTLRSEFWHIFGPHAPPHTDVILD